ncbi:hypothetical protein J2W49_002039 [Hydrogenophaga palleronii]|uniref:Uncharacterized protein n=1 Tax=Hydrogenophaga palleronii TaxID=65655 RepID=A0ABU1WLB5_9BURK|nr:hypothetical protein [Hydrogenophaga palleronii]
MARLNAEFPQAPQAPQEGTVAKEGIDNAVEITLGSIGLGGVPLSQTLRPRFRLFRIRRNLAAVSEPVLRRKGGWPKNERHFFFGYTLPVQVIVGATLLRGD